MLQVNNYITRECTVLWMPKRYKGPERRKKGGSPLKPNWNVLGIARYDSRGSDKAGNIVTTFKPKGERGFNVEHVTGVRNKRELWDVERKVISFKTRKAALAEHRRILEEVNPRKKARKSK